MNLRAILQIPGEMSKMTKSKCTYPKCEKDIMYHVRKGLELCQEHYDLFKFMDNLLFEARIEIILRDSRFKETEEEKA